MNRRQFIQAGAATAALVATGLPVLGADATPRVKKGIMYATIGVKGSVLDKFKAVKAAGFAGIEPMSHMDQAEVIDARDATGIELPSVCCSTHWAKPVTAADPAVRDEGVRGLEQSLRDAAKYGSTSVLFVSGVVSSNVSYADAYKRSQEAIRRVIPLAAELKVKIAIENVWNQFLLSPLEAARFVDEFESPWVGWHFDVGNVINYGWPEQWISILGKRIQKLHIKEYSRKKRDDLGLWKGFDVAFLEGDNNWPAIMKALDAIGYHGWGIAEQGGGDSPEGLLNLSTKMDKIFAS